MAKKNIKRKNDNFMKDALILFAITLVLGLCLGLVYKVTKEPIDKAAEEAKQIAYQKVYDGKDIEIVEDEALTKSAVEYVSEKYAATIQEAVVVKDTSGTELGKAYIVSAKGYGGDVTLSVGIDTEGVVTGMDVITMNETAGLGANCTKPEFKEQFKGKTGELSVTKSGNAGEDEIDALSGATITSKAVTSAVNMCLEFSGTLDSGEGKGAAQ